MEICGQFVERKIHLISVPKDYPPDLIKSYCLWWQGPPWLIKAREYWPSEALSGSRRREKRDPVASNRSGKPSRYIRHITTNCLPLTCLLERRLFRWPIISSG